MAIKIKRLFEEVIKSVMPKYFVISICDPNIVTIK